MKRSRKKLKELAKRALLGHYGTVTGSLLLSYLAMFAMAIPMLIIVFMMAFATTTLDGSADRMFTGMMIGAVVWYILILIVGMLFMTGVVRICYQFCIGQTGKVGDLLYAFKNHPLRFVGLSMLLTLLILLGSVPGIALMVLGEVTVGGATGVVLYLTGYVLTFFCSVAVALRYYMAVFILIEEPWRKVGECIRLSKELMDGNKMRLFTLEISFFGIILLGYLSFGLGWLWITPYIISTNICFYLSVKEEKYGHIHTEEMQYQENIV